MMAEVETMKDIFHPLDLLKFVDMFLVGAPSVRELVLDALNSPKEVEDLLVVIHHILSEDGGKRGQVMHTIVEHEDVPTLVSRL
jgi:hypothetical protein